MVLAGKSTSQWEVGQNKYEMGKEVREAVIFYVAGMNPRPTKATACFRSLFSRAASAA